MKTSFASQSLLDQEPAEWVDDFSLPVKERVRLFKEWMDTHYYPRLALRHEYEKQTGTVLLTDLYVPDAPFDPDDI